MKKPNTQLTANKANEISKKYTVLNNIVLDDWRGWRFIFDTEDVKKCDNDCSRCSLYQALKKEKAPFLKLLSATIKDKNMFGQQNFLNCKTIEQYINCYVIFLDKECKTKKEIEDELSLIKNSKVIYSKNYSWNNKKFKKAIVYEIKKLNNKNKNEIIENYLIQNKNFFS